MQSIRWMVAAGAAMVWAMGAGAQGTQPAELRVIASTPAGSIGTYQERFYNLHLNPVVNNHGQVLLSGRSWQSSGDTALRDSIWRWDDGQFELIAAERQSIPDTGWVYAQLSAPMLDDRGTAMFNSRVASGNINTLLMQVPGQAPQVLARQGVQHPLLGAGQDFLPPNALHTPFLVGLADGHVAVASRLTGTGISPTNDYAILTYSDGQWTGKVQKGDAAPGIAGAMITQLSTIAPMGINRHGQLGFDAGITGGRAVFLGQPGNLQPILTMQSPVPGSAGLNFGFLEAVAINSAGEVLSAGWASLGAARQYYGLWITDEHGQTVELARQIASNTTHHERLVQIGMPYATMNRDGQAAMWLVKNPDGTPGTPGLWVGTAGNLQKILEVGQEVAPGLVISPNHVNYEYFYAPAINGRGQIAIWTSANDQSNFNLLLGWDPDHGLIRLLAEGDQVLVEGSLRTIARLTPSLARSSEAGHASGFNDLGQIVLHAQFTDNSQAVLMVTVPEPGALSVLAAGSLLALRRRRAAAVKFIRNAKA